MGSEPAPVLSLRGLCSLAAQISQIISHKSNHMPLLSALACLPQSVPPIKMFTDPPQLPFSPLSSQTKIQGLRLQEKQLRSALSGLDSLGADFAATRDRLVLRKAPWSGTVFVSLRRSGWVWRGLAVGARGEEEATLFILVPSKGVSPKRLKRVMHSCTYRGVVPTPYPN